MSEVEMIVCAALGMVAAYGAGYCHVYCHRSNIAEKREQWISARLDVIIEAQKKLKREANKPREREKQ